MLPAHLAENIRQRALYYLHSTFDFHDKGVEQAFERFLADPETWVFKGPWVHLRRPFRPAPPVCLVGDGHQRIYRTKIPLSQAGIDVRGRSRRLEVNYRTSEQIRQYAQRMLRGMDIDDLAGGEASVAGDHSIFKGPEPVIMRCRDAPAEAHAVVAWVRDLIEGGEIKPYEVCVTPYKPLIVRSLNTAGIQTHELKDREDPGEKVSGVRLGSMKRIKGLEFRAVAMACAD